jgi:hypothetical protein
MKKLFITLAGGLFVISSFASPQDSGKNALRTMERARYTVFVHLNDPVATLTTSTTPLQPVSPAPTPAQKEKHNFPRC